jgi:hypothetical protein
MDFHASYGGKIIGESGVPDLWQTTNMNYGINDPCN